MTFTPHRWLKNAHVQTVGAALPVFRGPGRAVRSEHVVIPLPSGVESLHGWALWQARAAPTVLVLHGVGGSSESAYVQRTAQSFVSAGFHALSLDLRGSGRGLPLAHSLYHAGLTEDLDAAVAYLRRRHPDSPVAVVGLSLGGQAALLAASRWGHDGVRPVRAVVALSAPLDLRAACDMLDSGPLVAYRQYILRGLVRRAAGLARQDPARLPLGVRGLRRLRRIWDYDDQVIAPMHGFTGAAHYYRDVSCGPHLGRVAVPTLCIHAEDDPIVPYPTVQPYLAGASAAVTWQRTPHGGHLGFIGGLRHLRRSWALEQAVDFVRRRLAAGDPPRDPDA